jgi:hypothetical protein
LGHDQDEGELYVIGERDESDAGSIEQKEVSPSSPSDGVVAGGMHRGNGLFSEGCEGHEGSFPCFFPNQRAAVADSDGDRSWPTGAACDRRQFPVNLKPERTAD